jgi:hypothetical protein
MLLKLYYLSTQEKIVNRVGLAKYIADYIAEEKALGITEVDTYMILNAINAYYGGAR